MAVNLIVVLSNGRKVSLPTTEEFCVPPNAWKPGTRSLVDTPRISPSTSGALAVYTSLSNSSTRWAWLCTWPDTE